MSLIIDRSEHSNWVPLERAMLRAGLPLATCGAWMYMYSQDGLAFYKHINTRRYLRLDQDGELPYTHECLTKADLLGERSAS